VRHRPRRLLALVPLLLVGTAVPAAADTGSHLFTATDLRANHLDRPLGTDDTTPELSWRTTRDQTAYEVQAATSEGRLARPDLWDTGRVTGATTDLDYAGRAIGSRQRVYWRVRVWSGWTPSAWSTPTWFETGLTQQGDWSAGWVANSQWQLGAKPTQPVVVTLPKQSAQYVKLDVTKLGLPLADSPSTPRTAWSPPATPAASPT
jgi:alpha-L-rhamnosidase